MRIKTKTHLTSVKVIEDIWDNFQSHSIQDQITIQQLVNRAIFLYNKDEEFRKKIKSTNDLVLKGGF